MVVGNGHRSQKRGHYQWDSLIGCPDGLPRADWRQRPVGGRADKDARFRGNGHCYEYSLSCDVIVPLMAGPQATPAVSSEGCSLHTHTQSTHTQYTHSTHTLYTHRVYTHTVYTHTVYTQYTHSIHRIYTQNIHTQAVYTHALHSVICTCDA